MRRGPPRHGRKSLGFCFPTPVLFPDPRCPSVDRVNRDVGLRPSPPSSSLLPASCVPEKDRERGGLIKKDRRRGGGVCVCVCVSVGVLPSLHPLGVCLPGRVVSVSLPDCFCVSPRGSPLGVYKDFLTYSLISHPILDVSFSLFLSRVCVPFLLLFEGFYSRCRGERDPQPSCP